MPVDAEITVLAFDERFSEFEQSLLVEVARRQVQPPTLKTLLAFVGKPVGQVQEYARTSRLAVLRRVVSGVDEKIMQALVRAVDIARKTDFTRHPRELLHDNGYPAEALSGQNLELCDFIAGKTRLRNSVALGSQGAGFGALCSLAEMTPFTALTLPAIILSDVMLSITLLARNTAQIAACYGFDARAPEFIPHILAAMVPQAYTGDEGYLVSKTVLLNAVRESSRFLAQNAGRTISQKAFEKNAPQLLRIMQAVAARLGVVLAEKEMALLMPVLGAALNGSLNIAFQRLGHITAMDYFRVLVLEEKYGRDAVQRELARRREQARMQMGQQVATGRSTAGAKE